MRWPRQVGWLLFVLLLLVGVPVALVYGVGPPVRGWPDAHQVRAWVEQPLTEQTLVAALTLGAWLVWLVLAYTVTVRAMARLRASVAWLRRMPLPTPLQATASGMAGAAVFTAGANTAVAAPPAPNLPATAGTLDTLGDATRLDPYDQVRSEDGVVVRGGWLPREVADQVAAAGALVWLRRRLAYLPQHPGSTARQDADLDPLPATAVTVQAALADQPPTPPSTPTADGPPAAVASHICGLPSGGVGLTGPGAAAAGRGLLVTVLLTGRRQHGVSLVVTRSALASLLGTAADLRQRLPRIEVVADADEALRVAQLRTPGHPDEPEPRQPEDPPAVATPAAVLLITDEPPSGISERFTADVTVAVLGEWPVGVTWQVDAAGHTHDPGQPGWVGPRLCVLDPVAAADLLTVIADANPSAPNPSPHPVRSGPRVPRQATRHHQRPHAAERRLTLRILGEPVLAVDGQPLTIRRSAGMQALVFLAAHPDGADSAELVAALWPGLPRHSLTGRLYTTLSDLRGAVRAACGLTITEHTEDRYRLNRDHLDVDLWRFHTAVQQAATAVTDTTSAWQAVIDAYTGDLAAGRTWPWADPIREAIRRRVIDAHVTLSATAPDPRHALDVLQHGIRIDPYNTDLHLRAMNVLAALGDHQAVADLHHTYTRRLTEAGLDASDEVDHTATRLVGTGVPVKPHL
ncbi:BTAD domain-containing putative transcriptional regulator [Micromonospora sp. NPDC005305]|uniref:BTAD domain-containing putative transcriptional regulator n=1 Tax=Micromonospora sp. NPDC005305 TaxID=3156875 RepID=UPI0033BD3555